MPLREALVELLDGQARTPSVSGGSQKQVQSILCSGPTPPRSFVGLLTSTKHHEFTQVIGQRAGWIGEYEGKLALEEADAAAKQASRAVSATGKSFSGHGCSGLRFADSSALATGLLDYRNIHKYRKRCDLTHRQESKADRLPSLTFHRFEEPILPCQTSSSPPITIPRAAFAAAITFSAISVRHVVIM